MTDYIINDIIPQGRRNRPGKKMQAKWLTVHDTANTSAGADALAHARYLKGSAADVPASWHFTVDEKRVVQHLPLDEIGWHAGDGANGPGNTTSVGIEICEHSDGDRAAAEDMALRLIVDLLKLLNLTPEAVVPHKKWTGKNCPRVLLPRWEDWMARIRGRYHGVMTAILGPPQASVSQAKEWARQRGAHERFVGIASTYWSMGVLMGMRPEVLYAQAAKETAFGRYTGQVKPEQNNWAGVKIKSPTGDKPEDHASFVTPAEGVRAHFNHLAAYVGIEPLGVPHDRYHVVKALPWAGSIKAVEELSGRWAPSLDYGQSIVRDYLKGLLTTVAIPELTEDMVPLADYLDVAQALEIHKEKLARIKEIVG